MLTNTIAFLNGFGPNQPMCGLAYVLMNVQAFCLGKLKVV